MLITFTKVLNPSSDRRDMVIIFVFNFLITVVAGLLVVNTVVIGVITVPFIILVTVGFVLVVIGVAFIVLNVFVVTVASIGVIVGIGSTFSSGCNGGRWRKVCSCFGRTTRRGCNCNPTLLKCAFGTKSSYVSIQDIIIINKILTSLDGLEGQQLCLPLTSSHSFF